MTAEDSNSSKINGETSGAVVNGAHENNEANGNSNVQMTTKEQIEKTFGLALEDVYKLGVRFFRANEGKTFNLHYDDKLKLVAFTKQILHGKFDESKAEVGFFDFIGNDRKQAWEILGEMSKEDAMTGFIGLLDHVCSPFRNFAEIQRKEIEEQRRIDEDRKKLEDERSRWAIEVQKRAEAQKQQIQDALNRQTYHQFRAYSEQQYPGQPDQQETLIKQLQDQHYQQYLQQVIAQQQQQMYAPGVAMATHQQGQEQNFINSDGAAAGNHPIRTGQADPDQRGGESNEVTTPNAQGNDLESPVPSNPSIAQASMWTRKDIKDFKENIRKEGSEGVVKVGNGETVTVRVPTHPEGSCLFWEFATDHYDIGFGLFFEWVVSDSQMVSVHITESSDEEDEEGGNSEPKGDVEGGTKQAEKAANKPHIDDIIPIYRRDCHEEVYAGSHVYPGQGVYLLKFDNSYSLWRSKTLYYRVYYSR